MGMRGRVWQGRLHCRWERRSASRVSSAVSSKTAVVVAIALLLSASLVTAPLGAAAAAGLEAAAPVSVSAVTPSPILAPGLHLVLNLPAFALRIFMDGQVVGSLPLAVGKASTPTPVCSTRIISRVVNPTWTPTDGRRPVPPGPANPLGNYWLALSRRNYGLHGTNNPASIGLAISGGCVRFGDADIEYLYSLVRIGTPVDIIYNRVETINWYGGQPVVLVHRDIYSRDPLTPAALAARLTEFGLSPLPSEDECAILLDRSKTATAWWWPSDLTAPLPAGPKPPPGLLYFGGGEPARLGQAEAVVLTADTATTTVTETSVRGWLADGDLWVPAAWLSAALGRQVHIAAKHGWAFFSFPELCMNVPVQTREIAGVHHVPLREVSSAFGLRVVQDALRWEVWR